VKVEIFTEEPREEGSAQMAKPHPSSRKPTGLFPAVVTRVYFAAVSTRRGERPNCKVLQLRDSANGKWTGKALSCEVKSVAVGHVNCL